MFNLIERVDRMVMDTVHFAVNSVESTALFNQSEPWKFALSSGRRRFAAHQGVCMHVPVPRSKHLERSAWEVASAEGSKLVKVAAAGWVAAESQFV